MYDYSVSESIPAKQPEKCFWLGSEKTFLDAQELHLEALGKQMSVNSCKSPLENFCSRDAGSFYLVGG